MQLSAISGIFGEFSLSAQDILDLAEDLIYAKKISPNWPMAYSEDWRMKDSVKMSICDTIQEAITKQIRLRIKGFSRSLPPIGEPLRESQIAA